jgi:hypothetical protein
MPDVAAPAGGRAPPVGYTIASRQPAPVPPQWSGGGWLRRAARLVDNKPAFVLESNQGVPRLYVTAQAGVNLEAYVNRDVNLYGWMVYRGDLRTNYMIVSHVAPLP